MILPKTRRRAALCGLAFSTFLAAPLAAQNMPSAFSLLHDDNKLPDGGASSTLTTSFGVESGKNLDLVRGVNDTMTRLNGVVDYAYRLKTQQTDLSLELGIAPETDNSNSGSGDQLYPHARLKVTHDLSAATNFSIDANYDEAKVTDQSLGFDSTTGQILDYAGSGTRVLRRLSAGIEHGKDLPFGYTLNANVSDVSYRNLTGQNTSTGSSYRPSRSTSVSGGVHADVSPMTRLLLNLEHDLYTSDVSAANGDAASAVRRRTTDSASVGIQQRLDTATMLNASIGYETVDTARLGVPNETVNGTIFGLGAQRDDTLGYYRADYGRQITQNGQRDSLTVTRERETTTGKLTGTFGISRGDSGSSDWIGSLDYGTELLRDKLTATLARSVQTDSDGNDVVVTRVAANAEHKLTDMSALDLGLVASSTEYPDYSSRRVDATFAYQHLLTRDVSVEAGLRYGLSQSGNNSQDADKQSVYLTLTRSFQFLH